MISVLNTSDPFDVAIALCWGIFLVVWAVSAFFTKRTMERSMGWGRLMIFAVVILGYELVRRAPALRHDLWSRTPTVGACAVLLTVVGLAIAVWARATLGSNWSGSITFKENHELIQRGPYAMVRHPIYTGLLLMGLGTAVDSGRLVSFVMLGTALILISIKAHFEERLMLRHFPDQYAQYRQHVKALIPGVW